MTLVNKVILAMVLMFLSGYSQLQAQTTVSFNFSSRSEGVPGWINVIGDPSVAVRTASDPVSGINISSVATANWSPTNGSAAYDGGGGAGGSFFPAAVMTNIWYQYSPYLAAYNSLTPQLIVGGLSVDSVYTLKMTGGYSASNYDLNPIRYTVSGATINGYVDVMGNSNKTAGAVFANVIPDANGNIRVYVNTLSTTNMAAICGIQIISGHTTTPVPVVNINYPSNQEILSEDSTVTILATATETGGSISRVVFFANSTVIGIDSVPPYNLIWNRPNEGKYTITATATDGQGNASSTSINISIESLSSFWSMTGNIGMNPDSNFVGNVDSVRLAFRTNNKERMSISPLGNVGIGVDTPKAALEIVSNSNGVLLPRLTTVQRNAIAGVNLQKGLLLYNTDSTCFQYYNGSTWNTVGAGANSSGHWLLSGSNAYDSLDNIGIGTSNTLGYKLAVNGNAIFTKIIVKPQANWPDYVFTKEYHIPALKDIEKYIRANNHLPGIISAKEAKKVGIDIGENQSAILKKIEELTLYAILQEKELEELKQANKATNEQNGKLKQQAADLKQQAEDLKKQTASLKQQQQEIDELKEIVKKLTEHK
jgi:Big-like domain-containing protein